MIIATVTLITILLLGSPDELFLIGAIEKGIKKEVVDGDRSKEVKKILKEYKKETKSYAKSRKDQRKQLEALFTSKSSSEVDFDNQFEIMHATLANLQKEAIEARILVLGVITDEEWKKILNIEKARITNLEEKKAKSKTKDKLEKPFSSFENTLKSTISDKDIIIESAKQLQVLREQLNLLRSVIKDTRNEFHEIIINKNATTQELLSISENNEMLRKTSFEALADMHEILSHNISDDDWKKVSKEFSKLIKF